MKVSLCATPQELPNGQTDHSVDIFLSSQLEATKVGLQYRSVERLTLVKEKEQNFGFIVAGPARTKMFQSPVVDWSWY